MAKNAFENLKYNGAGKEYSNMEYSGTRLYTCCISGII
jgi:hypothetical protein